MARIKTYQQDFNVTDTDKLLGSDSSGATRNYTTKTIADYLNNYSKIGVGGQMSFKFITNPGSRSFGDFFIEAGGESEIAIINKLIFSKYNTANKLIFDFFNYIKEQRILLFKLNEPGIFGEFEITGFNEWDTDNEFIEVSLLHIGGTGDLYSNEYYGCSSSGVTSDELSELKDVEITNTQQNDLLVWDSASSKWKNINELPHLNVATLNVSASIKTPIIHTGILATPKQITQDAVIEENYNAFLINTTSVNATITVGTNSDLKIIDL